MACFSPFPACRRDVFVKQKRRIRETKETYSWNKRDVFVRPSTRIHATTLSRAHDPCARCQKSHLHGSLEPIPSMGLRIHLFCFTNTSLLFHEYVSFVSRILFYTCERTTHVHNVKRVTYMALFSPFPACTQQDKRDELVRTKRRICETTETYSWDKRVAKTALFSPSPVCTQHSYDKTDVFVKTKEDVFSRQVCIWQKRRIHLTKETYSSDKRVAKAALFSPSPGCTQYSYDKRDVSVKAK